jgi:anti-sigma B factor antagonist
MERRERVASDHGTELRVKQAARSVDRVPRFRRTSVGGAARCCDGRPWRCEINGFSLTTTGSEQGTMVLVAGEVDLATAPELQAALVELTGDVIVDLTEVSFLDSSGLSALIAGRKHAAAAGHGFEVRHPAELVERAMKISGLYEFLNATGSGADGVGTVESHGAAPRTDV